MTKTEGDLALEQEIFVTKTEGDFPGQGANGGLAGGSHTSGGEAFAFEKLTSETCTTGQCLNSVKPETPLLPYSSHKCHPLPLVLQWGKRHLSA